KTNGIFRVKKGQINPNLHLTFIGKLTGYLTPLRTERGGHRTVARTYKIESVKDLDDDEIVIKPIISDDLVIYQLFI
ncbi:hypothetical protein, partial [Pectobacterium brasiliense]|uniref:hypothetical protein n=1 Tax=Pectobacterium brasiliense TaxID=180957 RepID=UPI001968D2CA